MTPDKREDRSAYLWCGFHRACRFGCTRENEARISDTKSLMIPTQSRDLFGSRDTKSRCEKGLCEKGKLAVTNDDDDEP